MVQFTYDHMHLRSPAPEATAAFCERMFARIDLHGGERRGCRSSSSGASASEPAGRPPHSHSRGPDASALVRFPEDLGAWQ
jgi:hypothetical protein